MEISLNKSKFIIRHQVNKESHLPIKRRMKVHIVPPELKAARKMIESDFSFDDFMPKKLPKKNESNTKRKSQ